MGKVENIKKEKQEKIDDKKNIPARWFILIVAITIVLSVIISLLVVNLYSASAQEYSYDTGTIIVQIQPKLGSDAGTIKVEIKEEVENIG